MSYQIVKQEGHIRFTRARLLLRCGTDRFHSRGQQLCKFLGTKEGFYMRKVFNPHRIFLVHQHGRCFIVLEHQYGRRDVT